MNIVGTTKIIYFLFFLASSINPLSFANQVFFNRDLEDHPNKTKQIFSNQKKSYSNSFSSNNSLTLFDISPTLSLNPLTDKSKGLEIQSNEQYQENNVIYAAVSYTHLTLPTKRIV